MTVEPVKGCVVTVTSVGGIALNTLAAVPTWYSSVEALSSAVPPYALFFIYFPFEINRNAVHPQSPKTPQERSQCAVGCTCKNSNRRVFFLQAILIIIYVVPIVNPLV